MGCDIHMCTEIHTAEQWRRVPDKRVRSLRVSYGPEIEDMSDEELRNLQAYTNEHYTTKINEQLKAGIDPDHAQWDFPDLQYLSTCDMGSTASRSYRLFAALAGVRNGQGFGGCDTGDPVTPIAEPKGFPDGADERTVAEYDRDSGDACYPLFESDTHSTSWLTLAEILAYDWDAPRIDRDSTGEYHRTIRDGCEDFLTVTVPELRELRQKYGVPDNRIRVVFWFDN